MFKNWWIWLIVLAVLVIFWLCGCSSDSPDARYAGSIQVFTVGDEKCERATLDEEGRVLHAEADTAACFLYEGVGYTRVVDIGGLRFTPTYTSASYYVPHSSNGSSYWVPTELAGVTGRMVTEESGYCTFTCWNERWFTTKTKCGMSAKGKHTETAGVAGGTFKNLTDPCEGFAKLMPWNAYDVWACGYKRSGGYYMSYTPNYPAGNLTMADLNPSTPCGVSNNLSENDTAFLSDTEAPVETGYAFNLSWNKMSGKCGQGYTKPVDIVFALSHSDAGTIMFRSTPYILTSQVTMAEPVGQDIIGLSLTGYLSVSGNDRGTIESTIVAVSNDGKRVIAQTDGIVPIDSRDYIAEDVPEVVYDRWTASDDPNDPAVQIYAPLWPDDPNAVDENGVYFEGLDPNRFVPVHCVPIESGDTINVRFDPSSFLPLWPYVSARWLTNDKNCDINDDGIVNLHDLFH